MKAKLLKDKKIKKNHKALELEFKSLATDIEKRKGRPDSSYGIWKNVKVDESDFQKTEKSLFKNAL